MIFIMNPPFVIEVGSAGFNVVVIGLTAAGDFVVAGRRLLMMP
jgi:hypothetical protein